MEGETCTGSKHGSLDAGRGIKVDLAPSETSRGMVVGGDGAVAVSESNLCSVQHHGTCQQECEDGHLLENIPCSNIVQAMGITNRTTYRQPVATNGCPRSSPKSSMLLF